MKEAKITPNQAINITNWDKRSTWYELLNKIKAD